MDRYMQETAWEGDRIVGMVPPHPEENLDFANNRALPNLARTAKISLFSRQFPKSFES